MRVSKNLVASKNDKFFRTTSSFDLPAIFGVNWRIVARAQPLDAGGHVGKPAFNFKLEKMNLNFKWQRKGVKILFLKGNRNCNISSFVSFFCITQDEVNQIVTSNVRLRQVSVHKDSKICKSYRNPDNNSKLQCNVYKDNLCCF